MYGMSGWGLGRQLDIGRKEADQYIERYFERYPGVRRYMDETRKLARERGYVEDPVGSTAVAGRNPRPQSAAAPGGRAGRNQCPDARDSGRYHQACHDRGPIAGFRANRSRPA